MDSATHKVVVERRDGAGEAGIATIDQETTETPKTEASHREIVLEQSV